MHRYLVIPFTVLSFVGASAMAGATPASQAPVPAHPPSFESTVQPFIKKNCIGCHSDKAKMGGLSLTSFKVSADVLANRDVWERVSSRIAAGEMPPKPMPQPSAEEAAAVTGWIDSIFAEVDRKTPADPGRLTAHRLNRFEYNNAIHDLFGIDFRPADDFPADDSGYGFDNIGDVLSLSPVLMEKYLSAAERISYRVLPTGALPKPTRVRLTSEHRHKYTATPIGFYTSYNVTNDADFEILAGINGKREPLRVTLLVDNVVSKVQEFDGAASDEQARLLSFRMHLPAGEHRLGARIERYKVAKLPPAPPDLRFATMKTRTKAAEPPAATPWIDFIELRGPYGAKPAAISQAERDLLACQEPTPGCAARILRSVANRAWRRPVTDAELARLGGFVQMALDHGDDFRQGLRLGLQAVLVSPAFLFRMERDENPLDRTVTHAVSDSELATRLSFFLWSSVPDPELLALAQAETLHRPEILRAQVARMLQDPKSERFVENFAGQWLELRNLDSITPDPDKFPTFVDLRDDMKTETRMYFDSVLRNNSSILDFVDSDYTFLNERLARHYGIDTVKGSQFRRVNLAGTPRGGVLTQGSVLTVSSYPTRTSPVIRGKWVLENFLNTPPPPPPPDVPTLNDSEIGTKLSLREQLEKHRANAVCASCHSKMDPLGFGLENFNAIGQWREKDGKFAVDSSGTLPSGKSFQGPTELKAILKSEPQKFAQCVTEKVLTYALGRGLERYDRPAVKKIVARLESSNYRFSELISGVVESLPFQMRRGEGERHVTQAVATSHHP